MLVGGEPPSASLCEGFTRPAGDATTVALTARGPTTATAATAPSHPGATTIAPPPLTATPGTRPPRPVPHHRPRLPNARVTVAGRHGENRLPGFVGASDDDPS